MSFDRYNGMIHKYTNEDEIFSKCARVGGPMGRFRYDSEAWVPIRNRGSTIITPEQRDETNSRNLDTYEELQRISEEILQSLSEPTRFKLAPAPSESMHMTLADLVSGPAYSEHVRANERAFREAVDGVFRKLPPTGPQVRMRVAGVSVFDIGVVVAVLRGRRTYARGFDRWNRFRNAIYADRVLRETYGVSGWEPHVGHITLFYVEDLLLREERDKLAQGLIKVNERFKDGRKLRFNVEKGEMRDFEDMSEYTREAVWPAYVFET